jgi:hypothetical protein
VESFKVEGTNGGLPLLAMRSPAATPEMPALVSGRGRSTRKTMAFGLAVFPFTAFSAEIAARRLWDPVYEDSELGWAVRPHHVAARIPLL